MDFSSIGFLFVIVMVSGIVAYLADIYGKKIGKKRLSIFGLRPKTTATLGTVFGGMLLSVVVIASILVFVVPIRRWVLDGSKALQQLTDARAKLAQTTSELAEVRRLKEAIEKEKQGVEADEKQAKERIGVNEGVLAHQVSQISSQRSNITQLKTIQFTLSNDLNTTRSKLTAKTKEIQSDEAKIQNTEIELRQIRIALQKVKGDLTLASQRSKEQLVANGVLLTRNDQLTTDIDAQYKKYAQLTEQTKELELAKTKKEDELAKRTEELAKLNSDLQELNKAADFWNRNAMIARVSPLTYRRMQEICRVTVPANLGAEDAQNTIEALMRNAQYEVESHGAKPLDDMKAAEVMERPDGTTPNEIKLRVANQIKGSVHPKVLIAISSVNTFLNEPVPVDFVVKDNPTIYYKGQRIGECDLDGASSNQKILDGLVTFGEKLKARAKQDQMIPQPDEESYGSLPADKVLQLVDQIKQAGRRVRLYAVVEADTHAADPLRIDFKVQ